MYGQLALKHPSMGFNAPSFEKYKLAGHPMQNIIKDGLRTSLSVGWGTKERYTKMQMEIFPENAEEASCNNIFMHDDGAPLQE